MTKNIKSIMFQIRELLAILHCDGGHHTEEVGILQSIIDGIEELKKLKQKLAENNLN